MALISKSSRGFKKEVVTATWPAQWITTFGLIFDSIFDKSLNLLISPLINRTFVSFFNHLTLKDVSFLDKLSKIYTCHFFL